jgi:hypothetical protein
MAVTKKTTTTPAQEPTATRKPVSKEPGFEPDTPSARALAAVGNLDGEDVKPDGYEAANEHGERYVAEKRKHRWGI